jgi:ParB family chromosome partitioning protein
MSQLRRLGMGLGALIGGEPDGSVATAPASTESPLTLDITAVRPNPFQPRQDFDEKEIDSLSESIKKQGLLQPVVVRPAGAGFYELVAGERRWRASRKAGLARIPAVVREVDDKRMLELALVENLQRRDLNPMEKARAFRQLMQLNSWTQEQLADAVALGRPTVANFLRLLEAPLEIQDAVARGILSLGHARALLAVAQRGQMLQLLKKTVEEDLSVRALEKMVTQNPAAKAAAAAQRAPARREPYILELEQKLMDRVGAKVEILPEAIVIPYGSNQQLNLILKRLGVL